MGNGKARKKPLSPQRYPYLLTGLTFCAHCGSHLSGRSAWERNGKIPYYEHSWSTKKNSTLSQKVVYCKAPKRFSGLKLESLVLSEVEKLITKDSFAKKLLFEVRKTHKAPDQETSNLESL